MAMATPRKRNARKKYILISAGVKNGQIVKKTASAQDTIDAILKRFILSLWRVMLAPHVGHAGPFFRILLHFSQKNLLGKTISRRDK